jgi:hypothetical protein
MAASAALAAALFLAVEPQVGVITCYNDMVYFDDEYVRDVC